MNNRNENPNGIKPILYTITFEIKKQRKKFYFFSLIAVIVAILLGYVLQLVPSRLLSDTQAEFSLHLMFLKKSSGIYRKGQAVHPFVQNSYQTIKQLRSILQKD